MPKPERFVFVCINERPEGHPKGSCTLRGSREVIERFDELLDKKDIYDRISLIKTRCMGPCLDGPIVAVFPDNCWYKEVTPDDVEEIVEEHLINNRPVERKILKDDEWD